MSQTAQIKSSKPASDASWEAALRGDRDAFQAAVGPHLEEVFQAAQNEVRYRIAVGDLQADDLTAEELVGETLARAWRDRHRRPQQLDLKAWLLALLFRVARNIVRSEARFKKLATVSLEASVPPEPIYDDDESFWEWYQPDKMTRWEDVVPERSPTHEEVAAFDEERARMPGPLRRLVFMLHDIHHVPLNETAQALEISVAEASRLLAEARSMFRAEPPRGES